MDELESKLKEYAKKFDDGFPMIPLGWGKTDEEIVEIINECLEKEKDVYELGYVSDLGYVLDDEDILY